MAIFYVSATLAQREPPEKSGQCPNLRLRMPFPENAVQWELFCEFRVLGLGGDKGMCRLFRSYI